jgi:hypothetical protein
METQTQSKIETLQRRIECLTNALKDESVISSITVNLLTGQPFNVFTNETKYSYIIVEAFIETLLCEYESEIKILQGTINLPS